MDRIGDLKSLINHIAITCNGISVWFRSDFDWTILTIFFDLNYFALIPAADIESFCAVKTCWNFFYSISSRTVSSVFPSTILDFNYTQYSACGLQKNSFLLNEKLFHILCPLHGLLWETANRSYSSSRSNLLSCPFSILQLKKGAF